MSLDLFEMEYTTSMICFECYKTFTSIPFLIQHIKHLHPFSHSFICKQNNCHRIFPSLNGLKKHLIANHTICEVVQQSNIEEQMLRSNSSNPSHYQNVISDQDLDDFPIIHSSDNETFNIFEIVQNVVVNFISKLYSNPSLPQNIVQIMIEDIKELFQSIITSIEFKLKKQNLMKDIFFKICVIFKEIDNIFEKLGTEYKRLKFLEDNNYYIKSHAFFIGERSVLDKRNKSYEANMSIEKSEGQIIQLRKTLKEFLELP